MAARAPFWWLLFEHVQHAAVGHHYSHQVGSSRQVGHAGIAPDALDLVVSWVDRVDVYPVPWRSGPLPASAAVCIRGVAPTTAMDRGLSILSIDASWLSLQVVITLRPLVCYCFAAVPEIEEGVTAIER